MASQVYIDNADNDETNDITAEEAVNTDHDSTRLDHDLQLSLSEDDENEKKADSAPVVTALKPENDAEQDIPCVILEEDEDKVSNGCIECQFLRQDLKTKDREMEAKVKELKAVKIAKEKEIEEKIITRDQEIETLKEEKEEFRKIVRQEVRKKTEEKDQVIRNLQSKIDKLERANASEIEIKIIEIETKNKEVVAKDQEIVSSILVRLNHWYQVIFYVISILF